jgi:hypothetical protein
LITLTPGRGRKKGGKKKRKREIGREKEIEK